MHAHHDSPGPEWYEPADLIDEEEPAPIPLRRPTAVLTPRGHCAVAVIRLGYELRDLDGEDRAYIVAMLRDLIDDVTATT
jgi:hypothetical protein